MISGFWKTIEKPIIALSPMDGVTDAAFRYIVDIYGKPSVIFTEFTNVEGIVRGVENLLYSFVYHKTNTPTVGQIFGADPKAFYYAAIVLCEMGFIGIDINMGCPDKNVAKRGGGAGLILTPKRAQEIIKKVKQGVKDWSEGKTIQKSGLPESIIHFVEAYIKKNNIQIIRTLLPVSVKTRIGFDKVVTTDWIYYLLEMEPAAISLHGRTLKQMYTGNANWDEIGKAAEVVKKTETVLLGNGDIQSLKEAKEKIEMYHVDGVLIGRASMGNPWVFQDTFVSWQTRLKVALEHCKAFMELTPELNFLSVRKHMAWYCKGFDNATEVRVQLMKASTIQEVEKVISDKLAQEELSNV